MKIKTWLMVSYFIVMLLPIAALYILYISLSQYDQKQEFKEYFAFQETVAEIEPLLLETSLYEIQSEKNYQHLKKHLHNNIKIDLYRYDGVLLYSSLDSSSSVNLFSSGTDVLYQNLNQFKKNPRTYSMKKPVFTNDYKLVGVYEITVGRKAWVDNLKYRTIIVVSLFTFFFIGLYALTIFLLNRKLNRPLQTLQTHMNAFAKGKKTEQQLSTTKDEIGELMRHFEEMKTQITKTRSALAKQQQEKEIMVASLSHDLKTPLTVVRTYSEALENNQLTDAERAEYKHVLFSKLDHMKQMIDDLAMYTALQSSQNKIKRVQLNGEEFFDMLFSGYEEPCAEKSISFVSEQHVRNSYYLDPKQMIRIIDNLMDNSIRYTPEHGTIWIAAIAAKRPLPNWLFSEFQQELEMWRQNGTVILIQNEGKAIEKEKLANVFQPFYQVEKSRGSGATSGLGLSIAKIIIEQHAGKINIWSEENKGTLIACWLKEG